MSAVRFKWILPVILLEYTAMALNRSVLPGLLADAFGKDVYLVSGICDGLRVLSLVSPAEIDLWHRGPSHLEAALSMACGAT